MKVTFLESNAKLNKYFGLTETRTYPNVKRVTSSEVMFPKTNAGLQTFFKEIRQRSTLGHCLLKGSLKQPLIDESRAGKVDRTAVTELLILDVDGLEIPGINVQRNLNSAELQQITEAFIAMMPSVFSQVSYISQASASMGLKGNKVSIHIYMMISTGLPVKAMKVWLKQINLMTKGIKEKLELSSNGQSLKWPLDLSIVDNTHLCFIAPPEFEDPNADPFQQISDRLIIVEKSKPCIDLASQAMNINPELIFELETTTKDELRKTKGLSKKSAKTTNIAISHETKEVLLNPDRVNISIYNDKNFPFVHCDINGGDSHAYYFFADNPVYMFNFKGEPIWEISKADPDFFEQLSDYVEKNKGKRGLVPISLRDYASDTYMNGLYDPDKKRFSSDFPLTPTSKMSLASFYRTQGYPEPDFIPDAQVEFNPLRQGASIDFQRKPMAYVNMYTPTSIMDNAVSPETPLDYESSKDLEKSCPLIHKVIYHMLGSSMPEYNHFVNWLAYIYQTRIKSEVAWCLTGVEGTGKGVFANYILKPLFGSSQVPIKQMDNIEEQFNSYMHTAIFLVVDEFRMANAFGPIKIADKLKNWIAEKSMTVRNMRSNQIDVKSHTNFIFLTNRPDAIHIGFSDRRYNIAPRQEVKLDVAYPEVIKNIDNIEKELTAFAGVLSTYKYNTTLARNALMNESKNTMRINTMSVFDEFTAAIQSGDIAQFTDLLDISLTDVLNSGNTLACQRFIKDWMVAAYKKEEYTMIPVDNLRAVFDVWNGSTQGKIAPRQFVKDLARAGLVKQRKRRANDNTRDYNPVHGIEVRWAFASDSIADDLLAQYFNDEKDKARIA
jgi:hypothetical protein